MAEPFFTGAAQIVVQGEHILQLIALKADHAEYQLSGFEDPAVSVFDYRPACLHAVSRLAKTGDMHAFARQFNVPAQVVIRPLVIGDVQIELYETLNLTPDYTLWVMTGQQETLPVRDYIFRDIAPLGGSQFAFLSVYRQAHRSGRIPRVSAAAV